MARWRRAGWGVLLLLMLTISACGETTTDDVANGAVEDAPEAGDAGAEPAAQDDDGAPDTEPIGDPIVIGASLSLTGPFSIPGSMFQESYELCVDIINERGGLLGRPVELIVSDNRSDTEVVVNQTERFINVDQVDIVFGTFSTLLSFPASSVTEQAGMLYLEPADSSLMSHSRGYQYNFGFTLRPIDFIGESPVNAVAYYRDEGVIPEGEFPTTAAVIYQDDFFPNAIARGLIGGSLEVPGTDEVVNFSPGYLAEQNIEVVYSEQFPQEFQDWVSLANAVKDSGADFLFVLTTPPVEVDIVRAMQTVSYRPDVAFFSQGSYEEFAEQLGDAADRVLLWSTWDPTIDWEGELGGEPLNNEDFVQLMEERTGSEADEDHAQAFTVCQAFDQAVRATHSLDHGELRQWLASRTAEEPVRTVQGDYFFDDKGLTEGRDVLLLQWQDGDLNLVFPRGEEYDTAVDLQWPGPDW